MCEKAGDVESAELHYENALGFDSTHTKSLIRMGVIQRTRGKNLLAHEYLTSSLRIDSTSHAAW